MEAMLAAGIQYDIFFYNPNIHPVKEYEIRKNENIRFAEKHGIRMIDADYDVDNWFERIRGLENEPERGERRLHPLAAFVHGLVGQADQMEPRHAGRDLALHLDAPRLQPKIGDRLHQRDQAQLPRNCPEAVMAEPRAAVERAAPFRSYPGISLGICQGILTVPFSLAVGAGGALSASDAPSCLPSPCRFAARRLQRRCSAVARGDRDGGHDRGRRGRRRSRFGPLRRCPACRCA